MSTVILTSDSPPGRGGPTGSLWRVLADLQEAVRGAIAMAFRGKSLSRGERLDWWLEEADVRMAVILDEPRLTLKLDVPALAAAPWPRFDEAEIAWAGPLHPDDTGFDLLGDVLHDIAAGEDDSGRFDVDLLEKVESLAESVGERFGKIRIEGVRRPSSIDSHLAGRALAIRGRTPPPQAAMVVGTLDAIRPDFGAFRIRARDGHHANCILRGDEDIAGLGPLLGHPVLVAGTCVFRASGAILRLEVDEVRRATAADSYFERLPRPNRRAFELGRILRDQGHRGGVAAILGRWPGDETDEEIEAWLKTMS